MNIFNTASFERQGNTDNDIHLNNTEDIRESIIKLSSSALRSIKIFTPDFEHKLYDNENFQQTILSFVRGNRHAKIQILVSDMSHSAQYGHRILRLAQQLTSAIEIKITPEYYQSTNISFIQIDQSNFLFKAHSSNQHAIRCHCKSRSNSLLDFFTLTWDQAEEAPQSKQLHI